MRALGTLGYKDVAMLGVDFTKADLSKYDLLHYSYFHPYFLTLPAKKPTRGMVVTIHDLIPLIYPVHNPPGIRGRLNFLEQKRRLRNADAIITISETSKKDICRFLKINPDKIHVVYLAPKDIFKSKVSDSMYRYIESKYKLPAKFVLYVGDINYNKNIPGLIKAVKLSGIPLVIVGKNALKIEELAQSNHPEHIHLKEILTDIKSKGVVRLGFVPDEDLAAIYGLAGVYCQPSYYEGFGLVILEAQACGCPVITSNTSSMPEIAGKGAILVDPYSVDDIIRGMKEVSKNREKVVKAGFGNIKRFSWEKCARETLKVLESL